VPDAGAMTREPIVFTAGSISLWQSIGSARFGGRPVLD
jgi:hypothetical protein